MLDTYALGAAQTALRLSMCQRTHGRTRVLWLRTRRICQTDRQTALRTPRGATERMDGHVDGVASRLALSSSTQTQDGPPYLDPAIAWPVLRALYHHRRYAPCLAFWSSLQTDDGEHRMCDEDTTAWLDTTDWTQIAIRSSSHRMCRHALRISSQDRLKPRGLRHAGLPGAPAQHTPNQRRTDRNTFSNQIDRI